LLQPGRDILTRHEDGKRSKSRDGKFKLIDLKSYAVIENLIAGDFIKIDERGIRATFRGLGLLDFFIADVCLSIEDLVKKHF